jgi:HEAT repeat protein
MGERQLDLFEARGQEPIEGPPPDRAVIPAALDDHALVAALPGAGLEQAASLAAEAGRRRLAAAIPALEALCRHFAGFGVERPVPEQIAALQALAAIGGRDAARIVITMLEGGIVQGPTLAAAAGAADALQAILPARIAAAFLAHDDPGVRRAACRCAPPAPELVPALLARLDDLDRGVAHAAACALGRLGRPEARPALAMLLATDPAEDVIEAIAPIADESCLVLLARVARTAPDLAPAVLEALEVSGHPRAEALAGRLNARS